MCIFCFSDFLSCETDLGCYEKAITVSANSNLTGISFHSICNNPDDFVFTCADAYSLMRDYPPSCEDAKVLKIYFGLVETCMMKVCETFSNVTRAQINYY